MYWNIFKRLSLFLLLCLSVISCTSRQGKELKSEEKQKEVEELSSEEKIVRKIENKLKIPATEEYDIQFLKKYIDADTLIDALILVNREHHAFENVKKSNTERFFEKTGFTAPQNYVFVQLGGSNELLSTAPVGSNAKFPLQAQFLSLTSRAHQDFYVDYRIRNSMQRNYYTVRNNKIYLTFSCPVFDHIGEENPEAYAIKHKESSVRIAKDIAMYNGVIEDYSLSSIDNPNGYTPKNIISTGELYVYFIFDSSDMKYKTPMQSPTEDEN